MAIETRTALVTVKVAEPVTFDSEAVIVDEPVERLLPKPVPETVTTLLLEEDQTTEEVMSWVVPSR